MAFIARLDGAYDMAEEADVVLFRIPLCGRCKVVEANLARVRKQRPETTVRIYTLPDHVSLARRYKLLNIPAMIIRGRGYGGVLSVERILAALDNPA